MAEPLADTVVRKIAEATGQYHRLVLLVAPSGGGKTPVLHEVRQRIAAPLINVNLELSRRMLDCNERQRALQAPRFLASIVAECAEEVVLLDNTEILFDVSLKQDPLRLLQGISRNTTVVAAWNGSVDDQHVFYAMPGHLEYRSYLLREIPLIVPAAAA